MWATGPASPLKKKEGRARGHSGVTLQDLPGVYSLSPYTPEEIITRDYLVKERPDAIINLVDATNLERNLYLTSQLLELGIPVVVALNMMDLVKKSGDMIDRAALSKALGCPVVEISALRNQGLDELLRQAVQAAQKAHSTPPNTLSGPALQAVRSIEQLLEDQVEPALRRFMAIKLFERDTRVTGLPAPDKAQRAAIEELIHTCEEQLEDDSEAIITAARYEWIGALSARAVRRAHAGHKHSLSDRIDRVVTNRVLALPIFALVMFLLYYISVTTVGTLLTDFTNETLFSEWIAAPLRAAMEGAQVSPVLVGLTVDGIVSGVGAVLGFVPQMLMLFILLGILEEVGYLARVAFIMDRVFRRFGLSGKSFIPMLIGSGCSVPGIMASRTIEQERDRRMTIITTSFIPCSAKMPILAMFAGAVYGNSGWVAALAYLAGVMAVVISGVILKKTRRFAGDAAPFVMELPAYHLPRPANVLRAAWERGWSFIKRAGSVILLSSVALWFLQAFGLEGGRLTMVEDNNTSILAAIGRFVAPLFAPLGFGGWKHAVATFTGLIAKENVVNTYGVLYGFAEVAEDGLEIWSRLAVDFTGLSAASFILFNLLCVPCFAAVGAIKREMNSARWTGFALVYQTTLAYTVSLMTYQLGLLLAGGAFTAWTVLALCLAGGLLYLLFRPRRRLPGGIAAPA
jgi:ferrous iron transport protein B